MSDLFRQILESVTVGILVFDAAGRLVFVNPAAEEILRGSARTFAGKHFRTIFKESPAVMRIVRKALEEGAEVTGFDVALVPPRRAPAESREESPPLSAIIGASPLLSDSGERRGTVLSIKLSEILAMVGQEERAAVSAEEMQMLAYGIAHEIKNPLGGIRGAAQWLLRREGTGEERREGVQLILREAERINGLVEKMLEMSRTPPPARPFSLFPLLQEAAQLLRAEVRAQGKEIAFELFVDPSLPDASGHADTVFRAILNILKNAAEAIPAKGTVKIEARMNVGYRFGTGRGRKRSFLEITISDDGVGMSEDAVRKASIPFYTTKPGGTGLGLAMARQAVSRHGGQLDIKSVRGRGTTVRISLPASPGRT